MNSAQTKLERAKRLLSEVKDEISSGASSQTFRIEFRPVFGGHALVGLISEKAKDTGWKIVDALKQINEALDKSVAILAVANGKSETDTSFPMLWTSSSEVSANSRASRKLKDLELKVTESAFKQILQFASDQDFWTLRQLVNLEKHRSELIEFELSVDASSARIGQVTTFTYNPDGYDYAIGAKENGKVLAFVGSGTDLSQVEVKAGLNPRFKDTSHFGGHLAVRVLENLVARAQEYLDLVFPTASDVPANPKVVSLADFRRHRHK